jgi:hypothetical protein
MINRERIFHHRRVLKKTQYNTFSKPREPLIRTKNSFSIAWKCNENVHWKQANSGYIWAWTDKSPVAILLDMNKYALLYIKTNNGIKHVIAWRYDVDWRLHRIVEPERIKTEQDICEFELERIGERESSSFDMKYNSKTIYYTDYSNMYWLSREKMICYFNHDKEKISKYYCGDNWGSNSAICNKKIGCLNVRHILKRNTRHIIEEELGEYYED